VDLHEIDRAIERRIAAEPADPAPVELRAGLVAWLEDRGDADKPWTEVRPMAEAYIAGFTAGAHMIDRMHKKK
jgi:hypothetical protein